MEEFLGTFIDRYFFLIWRGNGCDYRSGLFIWQEYFGLVVGRVGKNLIDWIFGKL